MVGNNCFMSCFSRRLHKCYGIGRKLIRNFLLFTSTYGLNWGTNTLVATSSMVPHYIYCYGFDDIKWEAIFYELISVRLLLRRDLSNIQFVTVFQLGLLYCYNIWWRNSNAQAQHSRCVLPYCPFRSLCSSRALSFVFLIKIYLCMLNTMYFYLILKRTAALSHFQTLFVVEQALIKNKKKIMETNRKKKSPIEKKRAENFGWKNNSDGQWTDLRFGHRGQSHHVRIDTRNSSQSQLNKLVGIEKIRYRMFNWHFICNICFKNR